MPDVTPLPEGEGSYLCRVDLYRTPSGDVRAELVDMPGHVIEARETVARRFAALSGWCFKASLDFLRQGERFNDAPPS